jgi:hypothetical protein
VEATAELAELSTVEGLVSVGRDTTARLSPDMAVEVAELSTVEGLVSVGRETTARLSPDMPIGPGDGEVGAAVAEERAVEEACWKAASTMLCRCFDRLASSLLRMCAKILFK